MQKVKSGFIFLPFSEYDLEAHQASPIVPKCYITSFLGGLGIFAKLDSESPNGYEVVTVSEYDNA